MSDKRVPEKRQRPRINFVAWLFGAGVSTAVALVLLTGAWLWWSVHKPVSIDSAPFEIASGDNLGSFGKQLKARGVVDEALSLRVWGRLTGEGRKIKAGTYVLKDQKRLVDVLGQLVRGDVVTHKVAFIEGWRFRDWLAALAKAPEMQHTVQGLSSEEIMESIGAPGVHPEGRLFPDTYTYSAGSSDVDVLRRAYGKMQEVLNAAWESRADTVPLANADQALILASIIEKETGAAEERARIAGVFANRLKKRMRRDIFCLQRRRNTQVQRNAG